MAFNNVVLYFNNYFTKVGTLLSIVHCFILDGKFQGYLAISIFTQHFWKCYKLI
jgi:hypothetical protein